MVAYLAKSNDNTEFHQIVNFLSSCSINYALTQIHAIVNGKAVVILESSMISDLLFDGEDGGDSVERAITIDSSLVAAQNNDNINKTQTTAMPNVDLPQGMDTCDSPRRQETMGGTPAQTRSERVFEQPNEPPLSEGLTCGSGEGRMEQPFELTDTIPPTPHDSPLIGGYTPGSDEARQEQERYNLKKALELQKQLYQRKKDVDKGDQTQDIDWNDPKVLRYYAFQNRVFSKVEGMGSNSHFYSYFEIEKEVMKRSGFNLQQESSKKQKLDEQTEEEVKAQADTDQEIEEMKLYVKIVPDKDIAIDVIPLVIVEYKIVKEGKICTYHIIRADGSTKRYTSMIKLLENIYREDLENIWKLVKDKHGNTRPEEDYERVLWGDIKVMFEPDIESKVWRQL
nr:hypothetical protein [Tanacetum cinerariifolium]